MLGTYALSSGYYDAYYGQAQKVRTKIAEDFAAAFAERRLRRHPDLALGRLRARREDRRPAGDVPERLLHGADEPRRHPGDLDPRRARRARRAAARSCRSASRSPRPAFAEQKLLDAAYALEQGDRLRRQAGGGRGEWLSCEAVIGLEIHVQLATRTKMFCGCELSFGDEPNVHTCPVCLAHPGVLPVPNEQAIRYALQIAAALECEVAPRSIFHRKNYFYPDSPKAYQISQYDIPLAGDGRLGDVRIHRAHLEEDAAKMIHVGESGRIHGSGASLVDFNRGGTPLVEIVTEPDLRSAAEAARVGAAAARDGPPARRLRRQHGGGQPAGRRQRLGAPGRQRGAGDEDRAEEHEQLPLPRARDRGRARAPARADRGGGDGRAGDPPLRPARAAALTSLRSKEEAHDYRYFPEPDLVPLAPTEEMLREAREALPELPAARIERYAGELGLAEDAPRLLAADPETAAYFEQVAAAADGRRAAASSPTGSPASWPRRCARTARTAGAPSRRSSRRRLAALVAMVAGEEDLPRQRQDSAGGAGRRGRRPGGDRRARGPRPDRPTRGELEAIVAAAIEANPEAAEQIRAGNGRRSAPIVGAVMKETKGRADGGEVNRLIREQARPGPE